jgi:hypothetical protein
MERTYFVLSPAEVGRSYFVRFGFGVSSRLLSMKTIFITILLTVAGLVPVRAADEPIDVSMVQLIARPEKFHGKFVRVIGYLHLEFEGNGLYLHSEDYLVANTKNSIWFDGTVDTMKRPKDFNDQYILAEGTFDAKGHGHMGLFSGELHDIKRVQPWARVTREQPKPKK